MVDASLIIALLAVLVSIATYVDSRKKVNEALKAARESAASAKRSADADERMAALAEAEANVYRPPWLLIQQRTNSWVLKNDSTEDALDVRLSGGFARLKDAEDGEVILGGNARAFTAIPGGGLDRKLPVTWARPNGDARTWTTPLPA
jgi:hypothetical protein